jgi:2-polyprenyl-6-hydroxyphenyl methylase / 3-demethylubiquinone-9 3-methyltransferase
MLRKDQLKPDTIASGTADAAEVARFDALAAEWWKPDGAFTIVHSFNACRVALLTERLAVHFGRDPSAPRPLEGLALLDVGSGAGLVAEAMARNGARVTGIDAAARNVAIATRHASDSGLAVAYRTALPEVLVDEGQTFDIVLSLEVVEHVADVGKFLDACSRLTGSGGVLAVATLNRTARSFAVGIVGAEYIMGFLPRGTHDWRRFVTPEELDGAVRSHGLRRREAHGLFYNPLTRTWRITRDLAVNYVAIFAR